MESLNFVSLEDVKRYRGTGAAGSAADLGGDAFMQIIDSMIEGMKENAVFPETGGDVSAADLFEELNNSKLEAASMMAAGLMGFLPSMNGFDGLEALSQLAQSGAAEQALGLDSVSVDGGAYAQLAGMLARSVYASPQAEAQALNVAEAVVYNNGGNVSPTGETAVEFASYLEGAGEPSQQQAEPMFIVPADSTEADAQAQNELLSSDKGRSDRQSGTADVEELAAEQLADTRVYRSISELMLERPAQTTLPSLTQQVTEQLSGRLKAGESEFTMSLKPEHLGEITVRIVEKAGKTTLSIVTATKDAAEALNRELATLKAAVSPMDVEVKPAVTRHDAAAEQQQMRFDDGNNGEQNRRQQQPRERRDDRVESFSSSIEQVFADLAGQAVQLTSA